MEILGKWEGYYQYGEGYVLPQFGEKVTFMAILEESPDGEGFVGTIDEDSSDFSEALIASMKGYIEGELISFIKTYSQNSLSSKEDKKNKEQAKVEIEYQGYIDEKHESMYGSWMLEEIQHDEEGPYEAVCTGNWLLKKVE